MGVDDAYRTQLQKYGMAETETPANRRLFFLTEFSFLETKNEVEKL